MRRQLCMMLLLLASGPLYSQTNVDGWESAPKPFWGFNAVVSVIPVTHWQVMSFGQKQDADGFAGNLDYKFSTTRSVMYETNVKLGFVSLGGSAVTGNLVSKIDKLIGYIGISEFSLKYSKSYIRGTASWEGALAYDMKPEFRFSDRMQTIDLIYTGGDDFKWSIGFGYMDLTFPMGFSVKNNQPTASGYKPINGTEFYDDRASVKTYGIVAGFDTLKNQPRESGPGWFAFSQDRFSLFGKVALSDAALERAKVLNPGYTPAAKASSNATVLVHGDNETAIGLTWSHLFSSGWIIFAVGYDLNWGWIMPESDQNKPGLTEWSNNTFFLRHGVIIRISGTW